jgi:membrane-associated protease RseP (regulator of RpoE activity)
MITRKMAMIVAASLLVPPVAAQADNPMSYRLLSQQEAAGLPHNRGALGMQVERAQQITDDGMTFDILRVKQVRPGSPGAQAGFKFGDQIIAVDGRVFASLASFAAYVGSVAPGTQASVDYIPAGGGPQQAQRIGVTVGAAGQTAVPNGQANGPPATGMSTGTKVAIGVGAAALFGCYELGCFSYRSAGAPKSTQQQVQQPNGYRKRPVSAALL